ncbi:maltase 2-like [Chironomus tepperi]|uniref:maltase 2-like n=1 Tax=Chironomus tepperi TaxID=113505 RepID=UPI00391EF85B
MKQVLLIFLVVASVAIAQDKDWWETANFYQIYPRSFKDSDSDGVGDLRGIISKLPYLKELGVTATWLSPILKSPQVDFGYDIQDFFNVDETFGTNEDLEEMFAEAKKLGIKIIMDFVPNHTSDKHEWFIKSVANDTDYSEYYVWHDGQPNPEGGRNLPPNNWQAVFATRAWTWNEQRQQYYLHQFAAGQPDLNYRNPKVVQEMKNVLTHWMIKGADGFRIDAINHLFEVADFRDEPLTGWTDDPNNYGYTHHHYTKDLDETYNMISQWRELINKFNEENPGSTRVLFTEAYANLTFTMKYYYDNEGKPRAHFPFNFLLIENLSEQSTAYDFKARIDEWFAALPAGATSNWVLGNHDKPRFGSRYGTERIDGMLMLLLLLPGVAVTYNGDEIGMLDYRYGISWEDTVDPQACNTNDPMNYVWASRDPERTPFQWDASPNAGFTTGNTTWLPVNDNYRTLNLAAQREDEDSFFKYYQRLSTLRTDKIFQNGDFKSHAFNDKVFSFKRTYQNETYVVLINFGSAPHTVKVNDMDVNFPEKSEVVVGGSRSCNNAGDILNTNAVTLKAYNAIVIKPYSSTAPGTASSVILSLILMIAGVFLSRF